MGFHEVANLIPPLPGHMLRAGRARVGQHALDLASGRAPVKLEGFLAAAVEEKVRIEVHAALSCAVGECGFYTPSGTLFLSRPLPPRVLWERRSSRKLRRPVNGRFALRSCAAWTMGAW